MILGEAWVIEIVGRIARHPEALHDRPRSAVADSRERDDFVQVELDEPEPEHCPSRLRRVAAAPGLPGQPPADLHAWGEGSFEQRRREPDEAEESAILDSLDGP